MERVEKKRTQKAAAADQPGTPLTPPAPHAPFVPQAPMVPPSPKVIFNTVKTQVITRAAYRTGTGWLHSPARLQLLTVAGRNLVGVAKDRGMDVGEVRYVRAARLEGQDLVYVVPTDESDPDKLEVSRADSGLWVNLRTLLEPADRLLAPWLRVRYDISVAGPESPVKQALVLDLSVERERRVTVPKKKAKSSANDAKAAKAKQPGPAKAPTDAATQANAATDQKSETKTNQA